MAPELSAQPMTSMGNPSPSSTALFKPPNATGSLPHPRRAERQWQNIRFPSLYSVVAGNANANANAMMIVYTSAFLVVLKAA